MVIAAIISIISDLLWKKKNKANIKSNNIETNNNQE